MLNKAIRELNTLSYGAIEGIEGLSEKAKKNEKTLKVISTALPIETTFMLDNE